MWSREHNIRTRCYEEIIQSAQSHRNRNLCFWVLVKDERVLHKALCIQLHKMDRYSSCKVQNRNIKKHFIGLSLIRISCNEIKPCQRNGLLPKVRILLYPFASHLPYDAVMIWVCVFCRSLLRALHTPLRQPVLDRLGQFGNPDLSG